jgi:hypothetical protein
MNEELQKLRGLLWGVIAALSLAMIVFGWGLFGGSARQVSAQAPEKYSQQTTVYQFTIGALGSHQTFSINNIGQAAHSLVLTTAGFPSYCAVFLEGSNNDLFWTPLAAASSSAPVAVANGQFQFFRVSFNDPADTRCSGGGIVNYVGYQSPLPYSGITSNYYVTGIGNPVEVGLIDTQPMSVVGIQCYNPNSSSVFVELFDSFGNESGGHPTLAEAFIAYVEIPATSMGILEPNSMRLAQGAYLGAATALGGTTPATTPLKCNVQMLVNSPLPSF